MPKERVVVFDGEDKFIAPRNMVYNKNLGEAQVVGDERPIVDTGEKKIFDDYLARQRRVVSIPNVGEPDFCQKIQEFISSRGDGLASPEQIMEAYQLFQNNCVEKPKELPIAPPVEPPSTPEPSPISVAPPPTPEPKAETPKVETPVLEQPKVETPPIVATPSTFVPLNVPTLGVPPVRAGAASGGGGEEKKDEPKKGSNWLIWLLIGGAALYFLTRKKD